MYILFLFQTKRLTQHTIITGNCCSVYLLRNVFNIEGIKIFNLPLLSPPTNKMMQFLINWCRLGIAFFWWEYLIWLSAMRRIDVSKDIIILADINSSCDNKACRYELHNCGNYKFMCMSHWTLKEIGVEFFSKITDELICS